MEVEAVDAPHHRGGGIRDVDWLDKGGIGRAVDGAGEGERGARWEVKARDDGVGKEGKTADEAA